MSGKSLIDITGKVLGRWKVVSLTDERRHGCAVWLAECLDCGKAKKATKQDLDHEYNCTACKKALSESIAESIVGKTFYPWLVVKVGERRFNKTEWDVKCLNCGFELAQSYSNLTAGHGCRHCKLKPRGEAGMMMLFAIYQKESPSRGLSFMLSIDEFRELTSAPCHYCNAPPSQVKRVNQKRESIQKSSWGNYTYNGIDRIDNETGYVVGNCVPCCWPCNFMKRNSTYEAFTSRCKRIAAHLTSSSTDRLGCCHEGPQASSHCPPAPTGTQ